MPKRRRKRFRRYVLRALVVLVCVVLGWAVVNHLLSGINALKVIELEETQVGSRTFSGRLRIGAYNIAHGRGTAESNWQLGRLNAHLDRLRAIGRLLRNQRLDIVVLNEVDFDSVWTGHINQAKVIAEEAGFPFRTEHIHYDVAVPFASLRFGNALLSRFPIEEARIVRFPGYALWETMLCGRKDGALCTMRLTDALRIRLLAVHLEDRLESTRVKSAREIEAVRAASSVPLVVAGDFNSTPVDFPCATLDADGQTAVSGLLGTGRWRTLPTGRPTPADLTFSTTRPHSVIDWILVPPDWKIVSKELAGGKLSDHYAVIMEVEVGHESGP